MALTTNLSFVSIDRTATNLVLKDTTGAYSSTNPGGYGGINALDFQKILLEINHFGSKESKVHTFLNIDDIISGSPFTVNSEVLEVTAPGFALEAFSDGVLELTYSVVLRDSIPAAALQGTKYLTGVGLNVLKGYDKVMIGELLYTINKSLVNSDTICHLKEAVSVTAAAVFPVKTTNTKILIQTKSDQDLVSSIGDLAINTSPASVMQLTKQLMWKFAAQVAFDAKDYKKADDLIHTSHCIELTKGRTC